MGRPLGSKNKPKVTTAIIGEVINKPVKKVETPLHLLDDTVTDPADLPEQPVKSDEDINAATLKDAQQTVSRRRKLSVKDKSFQEQLDFIFAEMKSLRDYVSRLEDALNVKRNDITNEPEPVRKKRGKSLTTQDIPDTLPVEKEHPNEPQPK